jgi:hypothetical protein
MRFCRLTIMAVALVFISSSAWCAGLSGDAVKGFIGAMQDLKPYYEQFAEEAGDDGTDATRVMDEWTVSMAQQHELAELLEKHGFTAQTWPEVAHQVTQAYMAVKLGEDGEDVMGQMRQSVTEIENSKDIPAEYKQQMLDQMKMSMAQMEDSLAAPAEDKAAVRPYLPQLDSVFEWEQ